MSLLKSRGWLLGAILVLPMGLSACFPVVATGVVTGAMMVEDRRSSGIYIEDQNIELKTDAALQRFGDNVHVNVISYNRQVLLVGQIPSATVRTQIIDAVRAVPSVRAVLDEMIIAAPVALTVRSNDAYITSKVKARMVEAGKFSTNHVKVVTENGVTYLMGLVSRREGQDAAEVTATTAGVQKVVRLFEYLN